MLLFPCKCQFQKIHFLSVGQCCWEVLDTVLEIEGTPFLVPLQWPHPKLLPPEVGHPSQFHTAQTPPETKKKKENFNDKRWIEIRQLSFYSSYIKSYRKEPKGWLLLIYLHSFKQIFSNHQKSAGNWPLLKLLIGKWLHKRMRINWRCSHFWTPCCKLELGLSIPFN